MSTDRHYSQTHIFTSRSGNDNGIITLKAGKDETLLFEGSIVGPLITDLTDNHIWIGNGSDLPIERVLSGDVTTTNTGVVTLANSGVSANTYYIPTLIIDSKGRITSATNKTTLTLGNGNILFATYSFTSNTSAGLRYDNSLGALVVQIDGAKYFSMVGSINTMETILRGPNGSQLLPVYGFTNSVSTGIYSSTTDQLDFTSANTHTLSITSSAITPLVPITGYLTTTLNSTQILVGNVSNVATAVTMSGDSTINNSGSLTLATVNANVGSFGSATQVPVFTVNAKGLITGVANTTISGIAATPVGTALTTNKFWIGTSSVAAESAYTLPASTTVSQLLYSSSNNVVAGLATANTAVLSTSSSGVPSLTTTLNLGLGSVTAVTYSFTSDANTGMFSSGADTIDLCTGGTSRFTLTTTGLTETLPLSNTDTTVSTSSTTGGVILSGGVGIAKNMWIGSAYTAANTTVAGSIINLPAFTYTTSTSSPTNVNISSINSVTLNGTGTATNAASLYIAGAPTAGTLAITNPYSLQVAAGNVLLGSGIVSNTNSTGSTSNTTGALTLGGGIGISLTTDASSSTNGGTFTTAGGLAIAKKLYVGTNANVSGQILTALGTTSNVSYGFAGFADTGFNSSSGSALSLVVGGTAVCAFSSTQFTNSINIVSSTKYTTTFNGSGTGGINFTALTNPAFSLTFGTPTVIGSISHAGNTSYNTTSDHRLKTNVEEMTDGLEKLKKLRPVYYNWIESHAKEVGINARQEGFIAHELQEIVSIAVTGEKDAKDRDGKNIFQQIDTSFLIPTLTSSTKELYSMVVSLQETVQLLTKKIEALEKNKIDNEFRI